MRQKALFLDRDGVVNIDHGYVGTIDRFEFQEGIFPLLRLAQDRGFRLVVITNQAGVARGLYTAEDFYGVTQHMKDECIKEGIFLDLVMSCFEHPDGKISDYARQSYWRKPNSGMILDAAQRLNLDIARSIFLGDQPTDMQAAHKAGVGHRIWLTVSGGCCPEATDVTNCLASVRELPIFSV